MDANKTIKLRQIEYKVQRSCGICSHGHFPNDSWGTCSAHSYDHEKHTGADRQLSIHKSGICGTFEPDRRSFDGLRHFSEFIEQED